MLLGEKVGGFGLGRCQISLRRPRRDVAPPRRPRSCRASRRTPLSYVGPTAATARPGPGRRRSGPGRPASARVPDGCCIVWMMPRSAKLGSASKSPVSSTAPAGTPAAPTSRIASCLSWRIVHWVSIASISASCAAARLGRGEARVIDQLLVTDRGEQPAPVLRVGRAGEQIDVIVGAAGLAWVDAGWGHAAGQGFGAVAHRRLAGARMLDKGAAAVLQLRVLHRHLHPTPLARPLALKQRPQDADRQQHAGAGVAERRPRLARPPVALAGDRHGATAGLGDHVESEVLLIRAAVAEALDLAVDEARDGARAKPPSRAPGARSHPGRNSRQRHRHARPSP